MSCATDFLTGFARFLPPPDRRRLRRGAGALAVVFLASLVALPAPAQMPTTLRGEDLQEAPAPPPPTPPPSTAVHGELADLERLAEESFAQDDLITAVALYRQLAERHTQVEQKTRIMMVVAWLQHQQGQQGIALKTLTEVLLLDPDYVFRPNLYSDEFAPLFYDAQRRARQTREAEASSWVRRGSDHMRGRRYDEARAAFDKALELQPGHAKAIYNRALADYHQGRHDDALDGFQRVLALGTTDPSNVDAPLRSSALTNQALLYLERGQTLEAEETLQEAVVADPSNATAWLNLGTAQRRLDRFQDAARSLERAWSLDGSNIDAGRNLALAFLDVGDAASARRLLDELAGRAPQDPGIQLYLGMARKALGDHPGAGVAFEAAAALDPDNRLGWADDAALQLATLYYLSGDYHGTRRQAERVTQWLPDRANGWVYLGLAEQSLGDLDGAREHLEAALRLAPTRPDIHNSLGSVHFERGEYDAAEKAFLRALELDPSMAGAQTNLQALRQVQSGRAVAGRRPASRPTAGTGRPDPPPTASGPADLGWHVSDVEYASLNLQGVLIDSVRPGSAAAKAGLKADDLLLKMDGRTITGVAELRNYTASLRSGRTLELELLRNNRPVSIALTVP